MGMGWKHLGFHNMTLPLFLPTLACGQGLRDPMKNGSGNVPGSCFLISILGVAHRLPSCAAPGVSFSAEAI